MNEMASRPRATVSTLVDKYMEVRAIKEHHLAKARELETILGQLENTLLKLMQDHKVVSFHSESGFTAYRATISQFRCDDRQALIKHAVETENFSFFTKAVSKEACLAEIERLDGALPPGVTKTELIKVNVRKS